MAWLSAVFGGVGAVNDIDANNSELKAKQAELADNQKLALTAAADAEARGGADAAKARTQGSKLIEEQKVAYANSGVDPTTGTAANVMADTRAMSELDAQTLKNNAAREAWGFKRYGLKYGEQAGLEAQRTSNRNTATVLTGVGRFASGAAGEYERGKWGQG